MNEFTKDDLRDLLVAVEHVQLFGQIGTDIKVRLGSVATKLQARIKAALSAPERGELVLTWRVPREQSLTLNQYAQAKGWQKKKLRNALDDALRATLPGFPKALLHGAQLQRWVRVTRFSTQRVDELSVDLLGGKMPTDSLVRCGVLHDDNERFMIREPRWEKTKPGTTHVLIEVFAVATHEVAAAEPSFAPVKQIVRESGPMTQAILGGLR